MSGQIESSNTLSETDIERIHIGKTLFHYAEKLPDGRFPRDKEGVLDVLSVGCAFGIDSKPVLDVFANSRYTGIDLQYADNAAFTNSDVLLSDRAEFLLEDALKVSSTEENKYGLVVIRHPEVFGDELMVMVYAMSTLERGTFNDFSTRIVPSWRQIFASSIQKLTLGGYMFVTTTNENEQTAVESLFKDNNMSILISEKNRASAFRSKYSVGPGFGDQFVIVAKKENPTSSYS